MAKKRDDEDLHDEAIEAAEEAKAADEETAEHVAAAEEVEEAAASAEEVEDAAASAEEVAEEPPPEEPVDEEPYEEEPPAKKAKVTGLTLTLCILNVLAALGFFFMLVLDFQKRRDYTVTAAQNEALLMGAGTKEDREGDTAAQAAAPSPKLSDQALKEAARGRGVTVSEPFTSVEDGFRFQLYSGEWSEA